MECVIRLTISYLRDKMTQHTFGQNPGSVLSVLSLFYLLRCYFSSLLFRWLEGCNLKLLNFQVHEILRLCEIVFEVTSVGVGVEGCNFALKVMVHILLEIKCKNSRFIKVFCLKWSINVFSVLLIKKKWFQSTRKIYNCLLWQALCNI